MPNELEKKRKEAFSALTSLQKQEQQLKSQIHAFEFRVNPNPIAVQALENVLSAVEQAIAQLQEDGNLSRQASTRPDSDVPEKGRLSRARVSEQIQIFALVHNLCGALSLQR